MTIEEEFFKCFGIDPIGKCRICTKGDMLSCPKKIEECEECEYLKKNANLYAHITSRILLELMCIFSIDLVIKIDNVLNYNDLKNNLLQCFIDCMNAKEINVNRKNQIKQQVRSLFEVEE